MAIDYSVTTLLASVKQRSMSASNQNLLTDPDMVRIASEEVQSVLIPYIESIKGEYFVKNLDTPFIQGVTTYIMPQRATGMKLRDVCLVDNQGSEVLLNYINPEDLKSSWAYAPYQFGFYPRDNSIVLVLGNLVGSGNYSFVRMIFFRRPNTLCLQGADGQAATILNVDYNLNQITVDLSPTVWGTTTTFDIINNMPPFQSFGDDLPITSLAGSVVTFPALPVGLLPGMFLCTANFAPIAQVPVECQRLLESLTAARILQYSGDPSFQVFQAQAEQEKKDLINVLSPRIDGSPRKIPIRNRLWGPW